MKPTTRRTLIIVGVILLVIIAFVIAYELTRPTEINYQGTEDSFVEMLKRGEIQAIYIEGSYSANIQKTGDRGYGYFVNTQGRVAFSEVIKEFTEAGLLDGVTVRYDDPSSGSLLSSILVPLILYAALFGIFMVVLRKSAGAQGQALNFGKTKANQVRDIKVRFNDVAGAEEEKQELLAQEEISEPEEEQEDARPLILVVEDNDDIRQYIDESLCEDYRIIQARNGKEGRDQAFQEMPALIVSDIMMPEMDGIEMMKILKNDIRTSHIPIILLTAKTSPLDQEEGYDSGADSYLMKPFSAKLLQSRIRNILSGRRRLAEYIIQHNMPSAAGMSTLTSSAGEASGQQSLEEAELAASIPELSPLDKKFMEKLNRLIEENMTTVDIDIAFMTDKMAMSHSSFYRKVKALTGVSANEYIRKMKLQRSMVLLQEGESNVTEVAMLTGFNNIGYFRKCFKKEYGISPSEVLKGKQ